MNWFEFKMKHWQRNMRKLQSTELVIATHNKDKLSEFEAILHPHGVKTRFAGDFNLEFPPETEETFAGNARIKAHFIARETQFPAIADDSGIMVSDLDNQPGVKTADWAETPDGRDYKKAMTKVWKLLEDKQSPLPRKAKFCSTICVAWPDGHDEIFEGFVNGQIIWPMRGEIGFGFDPIFMPDGYKITFGEMSKADKNLISHRALSLKAFAENCLDA